MQTGDVICEIPYQPINIYLPAGLNGDVAETIQSRVIGLMQSYDIADKVILGVGAVEKSSEDALCSIEDSDLFESTIEAINNAFSAQVTRISGYNVDARKRVMRESHTRFKKSLRQRYYRAKKAALKQPQIAVESNAALTLHNGVATCSSGELSSARFPYSAVAILCDHHTFRYTGR